MSLGRQVVTLVITQWRPLRKRFPAIPTAELPAVQMGFDEFLTQEPAPTFAPIRLAAPSV
jgi:hypothetical protein